MPIIRFAENERITTLIPGLKLGRQNGANTSTKKLRPRPQDVIGGENYTYVARTKAFIAGQDLEICTGVKMCDLNNLKAIPKYLAKVSMQVIIEFIDS